MRQGGRQFQSSWAAALAHAITKPVVIVVMGVSGSGKTTVAALLSAAISSRRETTFTRARMWRRCRPARR